MTEAQRATFDAVALWSQVIGAIAFAIVLVWLFRTYLLPAVEAAEAARNAELASAERHRESVRTEVAQARGEVEAADRDAQAIRTRLLEDGKRDAARIVDDARADAERIVRNAEGELQRARLAGQAQLRTEFIERALQLARVEADRRIDAGTNARLVNATVEALTGRTERTA